MKEKEDITLSDVVAEAKAKRGQDRHTYGSSNPASGNADRNAAENGNKSEGSGKRDDLRKKKGRRIRGSIFGGDKALWIVIITLLIFSVLLAVSATIYKTGGTPIDIILDQMKFIVMGIAMLLVVHLIKFQYYKMAAKALFIIGLVLTILPFFIGTKEDGAWRGFVLPVIGMYFQPFEFLKIALIMLLAQRLARRQENIENTPILPSFRPSVWKGNAQEQIDIIRTQTIPLLFPVALTCGITIFAVGNSTTLIIALTCFIMLFIGRVRKADLIKLGAIAGLFAVIFLASGLARSGTGRSRINKHEINMVEKHTRVNSEGVEVYYNPDEAGQAINAKMSIASGGFFGKGPGMSTHRSNLEEAEKDFAYAFIIEEYGAIGGLLVLLLYLWLFFRTIQIFKNCGTAFPSLLVLGLGLMIALQAMIHMLVSVALFPITGQQFPLLSKG